MQLVENNWNSLSAHFLLSRNHLSYLFSNMGGEGCQLFYSNHYYFILHSLPLSFTLNCSLALSFALTLTVSFFFGQRLLYHHPPPRPYKQFVNDLNDVTHCEFFTISRKFLQNFNCIREMSLLVLFIERHVYCTNQVIWQHSHFRIGHAH